MADQVRVLTEYKTLFVSQMQALDDDALRVLFQLDTLTFLNLKTSLASKELEDSGLLKPLADSRAKMTFTNGLKYFHKFKNLH